MKFQPGQQPPKVAGAMAGKQKTAQIHVPQCLVCTSAKRKDIERMLIHAAPYTDIERVFQVPRRSISTHHKKHLNWEDEAARRIIEFEAKNMGEDVDEVGLRGAVSRRVFAATALQKGWTKLMDDDIEIEMKDLLQLVQILDKLDTETETAQVEELRLQFSAFLQAVKEVVPPELWELIRTRTHELLPISAQPPGLKPEITAETVESPDPQPESPDPVAAGS